MHTGIVHDVMTFYYGSLAPMTSRLARGTMIHSTPPASRTPLWTWSALSLIALCTACAAGSRNDHDAAPPPSARDAGDGASEAAGSSASGASGRESSGSAGAPTGGTAGSSAGGCEPLGDDRDCDGKDQDCDGVIDDGYVPRASTCGEGECASAGVVSCIVGILVDDCAPGTPLPGDASCNAIDDDCDGSADEDWVGCFDGASLGVCDHGHVIRAGSCDDANPCTIDACDASGACVHASAAASVTCTDGNACTAGDHCGAGSCVPGTSFACAVDTDVQSGRPPFIATASIVDLPVGATVDWLVDDQQVASGARATLSVGTQGPHRVLARISAAGETSVAMPLTLWGVGHVALASADVDTAGATLPLANAAALRFDGAELVIPPGALSGLTHVEAREWTGLEQRGLPADGAVLELLPHGTVFALPVSLWLPLGTSEEELPCSEVGTHVGGYYAGSELEEYPVVEVDCVRRRVRIDLPHFSDDDFVERAFTWTQKAIRGTCKYIPDVAEPVQYGCEVWGAYMDIYDETRDAIQNANKAIKLTKTVTDVMEAYWSGPKYGAQSLDYAVAGLVDPARSNVPVTLDSALADATTKLQLNRLLNVGSQDRVADLQLALETLRYYRAEDMRSELVGKFTSWILNKAMAAPQLQIIAPLISAQVKTAFDVVRRWDERAIRAQYDHYVSGRRDGSIGWSASVQLPIVNPPMGDYDPSDPYAISDSVGRADLTGWFPNTAGGFNSYPSSLKKDPYHWAAFEILYQIQSTPAADLQSALQRIAAEIAARAAQYERETAAGWTWNVTNNRNGYVVTGSERDVALEVSMFAGQQLVLDLTPSLGAPSDVKVVQRTGAPDYALILHSSHYSGRQNIISFVPPAPGSYRLDVTVIVDGMPYRLRVTTEVAPTTPPTVSLTAPTNTQLLWGATPFTVSLEARDPSGTDAYFGAVIVRDAAARSIRSWMHSTVGNPGTTAETLTLEAGDYTLEVEADARSGGTVTRAFALHVAPCTAPGGCACSHVCSVEDQTECSSGQERKCVMNALGCLAWSSPVSCSSAYCSSPANCGSCGDTACGGTEDCSSCATDCATGCGDGCCLGAETPANCPLDCACTPTSCEAAGYRCGQHSDGCSGVLRCGADCSIAESDVIALRASGAVTCALSRTGSVACWGVGTAGQLGDGLGTASAVPVMVSGLSDATAIGVASTHACAVRQSGSIVCWGRGNDGELGDGATVSSSVPVAVSGVADAVAVAAGDYHSCALRATGEVVCWGRGSSGQLGNGATAASPLPVTVMGLNDAVSIGAGSQYACALRATGRAVCWGYGGQLGNGMQAASSTPVTVSSGYLTDLSVGSSHACAVSTIGTVSCWGAGSEGQLGNGTQSQLYPITVLGVSQAVSVTAGSNHTCARLAAGDLMCWGRGSEGQLGNGALVGGPSAVSVAGVSDATAVVLGSMHTCMRTAAGHIACWGDGSNGQLGNGSMATSASAVSVTGASDTSSLSTGRGAANGSGVSGVHACMRRAAGTVACWGYGASGQLGNAATLPSTTPVMVSGLSDASAVSTGTQHSCALRSTGEAVCWGLWQFGGAASSTPLAVSGISDAIALEAGGFNTCALRANGSVMCWGPGGSGQLGNGSWSNSLSPVIVSGLSDAVAISVGGTTNCALRSTGAVACWGGSDVLGNGSASNSATPVTVTGVSDAVAISVSPLHACALRTTGALVCWGRGTNGRLGNGSTANRSTPVAVTGVSGAVAVSTGGAHTCARLANGTLKCWGSNASAQLGDGTTTDRLSPVSVSVAADAAAVGAGADFTCTVTVAGGIACWGNGATGQLGDGRPWWTTSQPVAWTAP